MTWSDARVLVTGDIGFVGRHLVRHLHSVGCSSIIGSGGRATTDLRDPAAATQLVANVQPTHVFHLAGVLASPGNTWTDLYEGNVLASINLLDAIPAGARVVMASSSAVYGRGPDRPISEDVEFRPISPYAVSKAAQELVAVQHEVAAGARIVRARMFNLVGPGQSPSLVVSQLARDIARAETSASSVIHVGDLEAARDYLDVRDAVRAIVLLADDEVEPGAYNIASGTARSVGECVEALLAMAQRTLTAVQVDDRRRGVDIARQIGDSGRLRSTVNWEPEIPFAQSLRDVLDYWREQA